VITKFAYLKVGLSVVLVFVGAKMLLTDVYQAPIAVSLGIIGGILAISIVASLVKPQRSRPQRSASAAAEEAART
jgi:tellurite resistance protein TerC